MNDAYRHATLGVKVVSVHGGMAIVEVPGVISRLSVPTSALAPDEVEGDSAERIERPIPSAYGKRIARGIAQHLLGHAPPKIEGGSPARAQWLADVLAVEMAMHEHGLLDTFADELLG